MNEEIFEIKKDGEIIGYRYLDVNCNWLVILNRNKDVEQIKKEIEDLAKALEVKVDFRYTYSKMKEEKIKLNAEELVESLQ